VTYLLTFVPPQTRSAAGGALLKHERYGLELFGRTLAEAHPSAQHFRQGRYFVEKTGRPLDFGLKPLRSYPALAFVPIRSGIGLWATPSGITVRAAPERRPATY
jgi:hypothetical protein